MRSPIIILFLLSSAYQPTFADTPNSVCPSSESEQKKDSDKPDSLKAAINKICSDYHNDLSIPDAPALALVNSTSTISDVAGIKELAIAVLTSTQGGQASPGLAITYAPLFRQTSKRNSLELSQDKPDYSKIHSTPIGRAISLAELSIATAKLGEKSDGIRAAIGVRIPLYSEISHPLFDTIFLKCASDSLNQDSDLLERKKNIENIGPKADGKEQRAKDLEDIQKQRQKLITSCDDKRKAAVRWNASNLSLGFGQAWISKDANVGSLTKERTGAWLSGTYGFNGVPPLVSNSSLDLHLQLAKNAVTVDDSGTRKEANRKIWGFRYRFSPTSDRVRFGVEVSLDTGSDNSWQRTKLISIEAKIAPNTWVVGATGTRHGIKPTGEAIFSTSLKWGFE